MLSTSGDDMWLSVLLLTTPFTDADLIWRLRYCANKYHAVLDVEDRRICQSLVDDYHKKRNPIRSRNANREGVVERVQQEPTSGRKGETRPTKQEASRPAGQKEKGLRDN